MNKDTMTHPYMWTYSAKKFMIEDLKPEMIDIESIANGIAKECRFGGQIEGFYSVARHSIILRHALSLQLPRHMWIYPLMHDAAEGYIRDMCKPVKVLLPDYSAMEERIMKVIAAKYGLQYPFPEIVKQYDTRIVLDEALHLFHDEPEWVKDFEVHGIYPIGLDIKARSWKQDLDDFLRCFYSDIREHTLYLERDK